MFADDPWYESDEAYDRGLDSLLEAIDSGRYDIIDEEED